MIPMKQLAHDSRLEFDVADRMRRALRVSGLSRQEIADTLEVAPNTVTNWINGHTAIKDRDLRPFAMATGVPFEWLKYGYVATHPHPDGDPTQNSQEITNRYLASPKRGTRSVVPLWGGIDELTADQIAA